MTMGNKIIEGVSYLTRTLEKVDKDIFLLNLRIVNAYIVKTGNNEWILVDTGLENSEEFIIDAAKELFGEEARPSAIVLTHGHFDHAGSLKALTEHWKVPAFIHPYELDYITGRREYKTPDDNAGGGIVTRLPDTIPPAAVDIGHFAQALPNDGSVPFAPDWQWIYTPGHTKGHVSYYKKGNRILISGDAISTVKQESLWSTIANAENIGGPPAYLTENYEQAMETIAKIIKLAPALLLPSHGEPVSGPRLTELNEYIPIGPVPPHEEVKFRV